MAVMPYLIIDADRMPLAYFFSSLIFIILHHPKSVPELSCLKYFLRIHHFPLIESHYVPNSAFEENSDYRNKQIFA